jgi:hypothetical protein
VAALAVGLIRFANGATLSIEASYAAHIEQEVWNFSLMGEQGGANSIRTGYRSIHLSVLFDWHPRASIHHWHRGWTSAMRT